MKSLANGVEIPECDEFIWRAFDYCCVIHPDRLARCLHEEPPKSLNPSWRDMPETRFPLCYDCHNLVHTLSRRDALYLLENARWKNYPHALLDIQDTQNG